MTVSLDILSNLDKIRPNSLQFVLLIRYQGVKQTYLFQEFNCSYYVTDCIFIYSLM